MKIINATLVIAWIALPFLLAAPAGAQTTQTNDKPSPAMMVVDWKDPAIAAFTEERATNPRQSLSAEDEAQLSKLELPVVAFDRPPGLITRAFGTQSAPARQRKLITDPGNPVWYTIVDSYADVTIAIDADLRIQKRLPAGTRIYTPAQSLASEPVVEIIDREVEEGMEGLIAEYTIRRFPDIPYRVTIECSPATKQLCADKDAILRDSEALEIISARPPG